MNNIDRFYTSEPEKFAADYLDYVQKVLRGIDAAAVGNFIKCLLAARDRGARIFFIGNGGSAATASHFANDLAIGTHDYEKPFRAISLTDNMAIITAISNDFGYEDIFVRQLRILGEKGDVLVGISASGNSPNLIRAFGHARESCMQTVAMTAFDGGKMRQMADICVHVPTEMKEYGPAEDAHMVLDHLVGAYLMHFVRSGV